MQSKAPYVYCFEHKIGHPNDTECPFCVIHKAEQLRQAQMNPPHKFMHWFKDLFRRKGKCTTC